MKKTLTTLLTTESPSGKKEWLLKASRIRQKTRFIVSDVMEGWPLKNFMVKIALSSAGTV